MQLANHESPRAIRCLIFSLFLYPGITLAFAIISFEFLGIPQSVAGPSAEHLALSIWLASSVIFLLTQAYLQTVITNRPRGFRHHFFSELVSCFGIQLVACAGIATAAVFIWLGANQLLKSL